MLETALFVCVLICAGLFYVCYSSQTRLEQLIHILKNNESIALQKTDHIYSELQRKTNETAQIFQKKAQELQEQQSSLFELEKTIERQNAHIVYLQKEVFKYQKIAQRRKRNDIQN